MRICPRRVAHDSGVAQGSSSGRLVAAPRARSSSTKSRRSWRAAQARGVERESSSFAEIDAPASSRMVAHSTRCGRARPRLSREQSSWSGVVCSQSGRSGSIPLSRSSRSMSGSVKRYERQSLTTGGTRRNRRPTAGLAGHAYRAWTPRPAHRRSRGSRKRGRRQLGGPPHRPRPATRGRMGRVCPPSRTGARAPGVRAT